MKKKAMQLFAAMLAVIFMLGAFPLTLSAGAEEISGTVNIGGMFVLKINVGDTLKKGTVLYAGNKVYLIVNGTEFTIERNGSTTLQNDYLVEGIERRGSSYAITLTGPDYTPEPPVSITYNPATYGHFTLSVNNPGALPDGSLAQYIQDGYTANDVKRLYYEGGSWITAIGAENFKDFTSLEYIDFNNNSIRSIGASAFENTRMLDSFTFPDTLRSIGDSAFRGSSLIYGVDLNDGLESIGDNAFFGIASRSFSIPNSVKHIGQNALTLFDYTAKVSCYHGSYAMEYALANLCTVNALDAHTYKEPSFIWASEYDACRAYFDCESGDYTKTLFTDNITVTQIPENDREEAKTVYTAEFTFEDKTYTATEIVGGESKYVVITIDCGDVGEDVTVEVPRGANFFNALYNAGIYETLDAMENEDCIFRDLATKPLSEFADEEEFGEDASALLDTTVTSDMTVYAGFYTKLKKVNLTLGQPVIGTTVTVTDDWQTPAPVLTVEEGARYSLYSDPEYQYSHWYTKNNDEYSTFEGAFVKGETYYVDCLLKPDFGYWMDDDTVVTANGATVEEAYGRMSLVVSLSTLAVPPAILGDADGDGDVTILDATVIQRYLAFFRVSNPEIVEERGDINRDGIDILDATYIQRHLALMSVPYKIGEPITNGIPESGEDFSYLNNKPSCPECGSNDVAYIMYGEPIPEEYYSAAFRQKLADGEIVFGGCVIEPDSPKWHCNTCGHGIS